MLIAVRSPLQASTITIGVAVVSFWSFAFIMMFFSTDSFRELSICCKSKKIIVTATHSSKIILIMSHQSPIIYFNITMLFIRKHFCAETNNDKTQANMDQNPTINDIRHNTYYPYYYIQETLVLFSIPSLCYLGRDLADSIQNNRIA